MGYYIQMPKNNDKAQQLVDLHDAAILTKCPTFEEIPRGKALICVVDNGPFEAVALIFDHDELTDFVKSHLASYKAPARYEWVDELPRNHMGKVLKNDLRDQFVPAEGD